jgi:hypothetical protein
LLIAVRILQDARQEEPVHLAMGFGVEVLHVGRQSLARGVPMVVLPVAYDQPGVGARVEWSGAGRSIPVGRLSVDRLRDAVRVVLADPAYRARAGRLRTSIEAADGLSWAADLIEGAFGGRTVPETVAGLRFP